MIWSQLFSPWRPFCGLVRYANPNKLETWGGYKIWEIYQLALLHS